MQKLKCKEDVGLRNLADSGACANPEPAGEKSHLKRTSSERVNNGDAAGNTGQETPPSVIRTFELYCS